MNRHWLLSLATGLAIIVLLAPSIGCIQLSPGPSTPAPSPTATQTAGTDQKASLPTPNPPLAGTPAAPAQGAGPSGAGGSAQWTVLIYMAADNNLDPALMELLKNYADVGSTQAVNVVIEVDRATGKYHDPTPVLNMPDWTNAKRLYLKKGSFQELADMGQVNMSDPKTLSDFIQWGKRAYPAQHYFLIMSDHGGDVTGFGEDDHNSTGKKGFMSLSELARGLKDGGVKFDLLYWSACVMSNTEVALELQPYVDIMVGSEEVTWSDGDGDPSGLAAIVKNPSISPLDVGKAIVDGYFNVMQQDAPELLGNASEAVIDMREVPKLKQALTDFAAATKGYAAGSANSTLIDQLGRLGQVMSRARFETPGFASRDLTDPGEVFDLGIMADNAAKFTGNQDVAKAAADVRQALSIIVKYQRKGDDYKNTPLGGLTIFSPVYKAAAAAYAFYPKLPETGQTGWPALADVFSKAMVADKVAPVVQGIKADANEVTPGQNKARITGKVADNLMVSSIMMAVFGTLDNTPVIFDISQQPGTYQATADFTYDFDGMTWYLSDGAILQPVSTVRWRPGERVVFGSTAATANDFATDKSRTCWIYDEATGKLLGGLLIDDESISSINPSAGWVFAPWLLGPSPDVKKADYGYVEAKKPLALVKTTLVRRPLPGGPYLISATGFDVSGNSGYDDVAVIVNGPPGSQPTAESDDVDTVSSVGTHSRTLTLGPGQSKSYTLSIDRSRVGSIKWRVETHGDGDPATMYITRPDGKKTGGNIVGTLLTTEGFATNTFSPELSGTYVLTYSSPRGNWKVYTSWTISPPSGFKPPAPADLDQHPELADNFDQPGLHTGRFTVAAANATTLSFKVDAAKTPWLGYSVEVAPGSGPLVFALGLPDSDKAQDIDPVSSLHMGGRRVTTSGTYTLVLDNRQGKTPVPVTVWVETYTTGTPSAPTPAPTTPGPGPTPTPAANPSVIRLPDWSTAGGQDYFPVAPHSFTTLIVPMDKYVSASANLSFAYPGSGMSFQVTAPTGVVLQSRPLTSVMTPINWVVTQTGDYAIILDNTGADPNNGNGRSVLVTLTVKPTNNPTRSAPSPTSTPPPDPTTIRLPDWSAAGGQDYFGIAPHGFTTLIIPMDSYISASAGLNFGYPGSGLSFQVKDTRGMVLQSRPITSVMTPINWVITQTGDYSIILDNTGSDPNNGDGRSVLVTLTVKPTNNPPRPTPTSAPTVTAPVAMPTATPPALDNNQPPNTFYGAIRLYKKADKSDAYPAAAGAKVSAVIGGALWESQPAVSAPGYEYSLQVRARMSSDTKIDFYVDGIKADQSSTWVRGGVNKLDLTVNVAPVPAPAPSPAPSPSPAQTPASNIIRLPDWSTAGGKDYFSVAPHDTTTLIIPMDTKVSASAGLNFSYPGSGLSFQVKDTRGTVLQSRAIEYVMTPINWVITQTGDYMIILDNTGTDPNNGNSRSVLVTLTVKSR